MHCPIIEITGRIQGFAREDTANLEQEKEGTRGRKARLHPRRYASYRPSHPSLPQNPVLTPLFPTSLLLDTAENQRATTRTLRKRGQAKEAEVAAPNPSATSSDYPKKVPELRVRLTDEEMDSDMAQIQKGITNM